MLPLSYRLTSAADQDITDILRETARTFGPRQRATYAAGLIERAIGLVAEKMDRTGSRRRDDLGPGVRSFHVELAAQRRGAASHILYYVAEPIAQAGGAIVIVRVLHERMEPARHLTHSLP